MRPPRGRAVPAVALLGCLFVLGPRNSGAANKLRNGLPVHQFMTGSERRAIFGSFVKVPIYEEVHLPIHGSVLRGKRETSEDISSCSTHSLDFRALGYDFQLRLHPNDKLISDNFLVIVRSDNSSSIRPSLSTNLSSCYYQGDFSSRTGKGRVALAAKQGYSGIIITDNDHFVIHPTPVRLTEQSSPSVSHIIYKKKDENAGVCAHEANDPLPPSFPSTSPSFNATAKRRRRRLSFPPSSSLFIETAVFVDRNLYEVMTKNYPVDPERGVMEVVLTMINAVHLLFQHSSLGRNIDILLTRLEILKSETKGLKRSSNIDHYLNSFCKWQMELNPQDDRNHDHWDHALMLTGLDLFSVDKKGIRNNQVVGLAPVAGMCYGSNSCTVNEGRHFESVYVVAHEMGHNLGMQHDGRQNNNNCDRDAYIMSPTLGRGKITWSPCSRDYLDKFLSMSQSNCLLDMAPMPDKLNHFKITLLPGERFNAYQQCQLRFGPASSPVLTPRLEAICLDLQCLNERREPVSSHPALEGTYCGENKWCRGGECTFREKDGQWSDWSPFNGCRSGCLYGNDGLLDSGSSGTAESFRRCDNPAPENGGENCFGKDRRYRLCDSDDQCSQVPRITIRDYALEICNRAADVDSNIIKGYGNQWMDLDPKRACMVWCVHRSGSNTTKEGWKFPDGTRCHLTEDDNSIYHSTYCIDGECTEFCDRQTVDESNNVSCSQGNSFLSREPYPVEDPPEPEVDNCSYGCINNSMGVRITNKPCLTPRHFCLDEKEIELCSPTNKLVCERDLTAAEYATGVCQRLRFSFPDLQGKGIQLHALPNDPDGPCFVACQDIWNPSKFYKIGPKQGGWFPAGTDCSGGSKNIRAFCFEGICLNFNNENKAFKTDNIRKRSEAENIEVSWLPEENAGKVLWNSDSSESISTDSLHEQSTKWFNSLELTATSIGKYSWQMLISLCSVTTGLRRVIVYCQLNGLMVDESHCNHSSRPSFKEYEPCSSSIQLQIKDQISNH